MVAPIYREWFVLSSLIVQNMAEGIAYAFPAILTPEITSGRGDIIVTKDEASWITAVYGATFPVGYIFVPSIMQVIGRRITNIILNLILLCGSITIATAPNFAALVTGRAIHGLVACKTFINMILIAEYSHPSRRGISLALKIVLINIGLVLCLALSAKLSWRQIAWLQTIPSFIGIFATLVWPESPSWLAFEARYQECKDAFQWLRGNDLDSEKELRELLAAQQQLKAIRGTSNTVSRIAKAFRSKSFWKLILTGYVASLFTNASGTYFLQAYLIEIIIQLTRYKSQALYLSVGITLIKLLSAIVTIVSVRQFNRRSILFSTGSLSVFLFSLTCLFDYLNKSDVLVLPWLPAFMLLLFTFVINVAVTVTIILDGEICPVQYKGVAMAVVGSLDGLQKLFMLKITASMLISLDTYGTFFVYILIMTVALFGLYFLMPETKDKTLQEIENRMLNLKVDEDDEVVAANFSFQNTINGKKSAQQ